MMNPAEWPSPTSYEPSSPAINPGEFDQSPTIQAIAPLGGRAWHQLSTARDRGRDLGELLVELVGDGARSGLKDGGSEVVDG